MIYLSTLRGWIYTFCTGALLTAVVTLDAQPTLRITPEALSATLGEEIAVDLVMDGFDELLVFQIPIAWDTDVLEFISVSNINTALFTDYSADNFGTPENGLAAGQLFTSWENNSFDDVTVPDGTVVFTLNLRVRGEGVGTIAVDTEFEEDLFLMNGFEETVNAISVSSTVTISGESASCRERDSLGLVELYEATNGPGWTNSWDLNAPMETWYGVTLSGEGCVVEVDLEENNLNGALPDLILPNLETLNLDGCQLNGPVPDFSNLPNLTNLDLGSNDLSGPIPNFSNLPNLTNLDLGGNELSGSIPNFSNLPNLTNLDLGSNDLSGSIPNFSNLPQLTSLDFAINQLNGSIPDFSNLPQLTKLRLNFNQLSGSVPDFGNLSDLESLILYDNELSGPVPDFSNLSNLESLSLSDNELSGPVPDFSDLPNLEFLRMSNNQLSGPVPDFSNLSNLTLLGISDNNLTGTLPDFSNLLNLRTIYLGNNQLTGIIPDFSMLPNLVGLSLEGNLLSGPCPDFSDNLPKLDFLAVQRNQYTFAHLIPSLTANIDLIAASANLLSDTLRYAPQAPIYPDTLFTRPAGQAFNIDLGIDADITTNIYTWYKDGVPFRTVTGNNQLLFDPLNTADAGVYTVEVTNPGAPELTLESGAITIKVSPVIRLIAGEASGNPGDEVRLPILAENADGLAALQGKISFRQPGVVELLGVEPARIQPVLNTADGQFNFFDGSGLGLSLEPLDTLFYLRLRLTGARGSTSDVFFEDGENFELIAYLFDDDIVETDIETVEGLVTVLEAVAISGRIALYNDRPVAGVTVTAAIEQTNGQRVEQQEVTDANGNYRFQEVPLGSRVQLEPAKSGDMATSVNSSGLLYALQAFLDGNSVPMLTSPLQLAAADVDCDGQLTTGDLVLIQEVMTGLRSDLPVCPVWTFTPESRIPEFRLAASYFSDFPIPQRQVIDNLSGEATINFAGIKTGDVMGEAQTP